jgi:hypothetical protein
MCTVNTMTLLRTAARHALTHGDHETVSALGALRDVVRKLSAMPVNRNLVLVSPGFLLTRDHRSDEYDLLDRAIRANVTVNTIDMRGLFSVIPGGTADQSAYHNSAAVTTLTSYDMAKPSKIPAGSPLPVRSLPPGAYQLEVTAADSSARQVRPTADLIVQ